MALSAVLRFPTPSLSPDLHFPLLETRRLGLESRIVEIGQTVFTPYVGQALWATNMGVPKRDALHRKAAPPRRLGRLVQLTQEGLLLAWEEPYALLHDQPNPESWHSYREFVQWADWYTGAWRFQVPTPEEAEPRLPSTILPSPQYHAGPSVP